MSDELFGLRGKAAVVVGGGQGIGESTAIMLARAGCDVAIFDMNVDGAQRVAERVSRLGRAGTAVVGNALNAGDVERGMMTAEERLGGLDVGVTIIGMPQFVPLMDISLEDWDSQLAINLRHVLVVARAFAASLVRREKTGAFTCISSISGQRAAAGHGAYGAAKAGMIHMVKTMACEWAPYGIRVNCIAPGSIITPRRPDDAQWREAIRQSSIPMKRRGTVDEIASAALFLSSELASYITGNTINVDGGACISASIHIPPNL
jgi:NAD(P)-dependent dehydrogenase (short-subunit alcohol dehydrogenase family)